MKLLFLSAMSLRRFLKKKKKNRNLNPEAARSPLENNRPPSSNVTMAPTHTQADGADTTNDRIRARDMSLPGRDSVMLPDETESLLTNTLGVADTYVLATPRYSKHPSVYPPHFSFLWFC